MRPQQQWLLLLLLLLVATRLCSASLQQGLLAGLYVPARASNSSGSSSSNTCCSNYSSSSRYINISRIRTSSSSNNNGSRRRSTCCSGFISRAVDLSQPLLPHRQWSHLPAAATSSSSLPKAATAAAKATAAAAAGDTWEPTNPTLRDLLQRQLLATASDLKGLDSLLNYNRKAAAAAATAAAAAAETGPCPPRAATSAADAAAQAAALELLQPFPLHDPSSSSSNGGSSSSSKGLISSNISFYVGIDMTGPSLHAGHLLPLLLLRRLWLWEGVQPVLLLGTATARVALHTRKGSSSNSSSSSSHDEALLQLLGCGGWKSYDEEIETNCSSVLQQLRRIFALPTQQQQQQQQMNLPMPLVVRNDRWLEKIPLGAFLACTAPRLSLADIIPRAAAAAAGRQQQNTSAARSSSSSSSSAVEDDRPSEAFVEAVDGATDLQQQQQQQQQQSQQELGVGGGAATAADINYALLQALDFVLLSKCLRCCCQIGGRDQWKNISTGLHVARRLLQQPQQQQQQQHQQQQEENVQQQHMNEQSQPHQQQQPLQHKQQQQEQQHNGLLGITTILLEGIDGIKMGKRVKRGKGGIIWLSDQWSGPLVFWQKWRNTTDQHIIQLLLWFSERPAEEIIAAAKDQSPANLNKLKRELADELTLLVHGEEGLRSAHASLSFLSRGSSSTSSSNSSNSSNSSSSDTAATEEFQDELPLLPTHFISSSEFIEETGPPLPRVLRNVGLSPSALEGSRLIKDGAVRLNGEKIQDTNRRLLLSDFKQQQQQQQQQQEVAAVAVLTVGKNRLAALGLQQEHADDVLS